LPFDKAEKSGRGYLELQGNASVADVERLQINLLNKFARVGWVVHTHQ
jgi:hypothetical protein